MTIGERIGKLMQRRRVSYRALAERTGLHASALHRMVHGTQQVSTDDLMLIAVALEVRPATLLPTVEAVAS